MSDYEALLTSCSIYIATKEVQRRKHPKKRINKKWRKRYGVIEYNLMPHGKVIFNEIDQMFYMTKKTLQELQNSCDRKNDS